MLIDSRHSQTFLEEKIKAHDKIISKLSVKKNNLETDILIQALGWSTLVVFCACYQILGRTYFIFNSQKLV